MNTIASISTPLSDGGIAVVRLSGDDAVSIAKKIIKFKDNGAIMEPRRFYYCTADTGEFKDEVLAVYFKAPKSYTREDIIEIHCHGSCAVAEGILRALIRNGARCAEAGEFTKRAFLNNRIDLTQAEAVIDLINAKSTAQINAAYDTLKGGLYKRIESVQNAIVKMTAAAGAAVDYPEEGIEQEEKEILHNKILKIIDELDILINEYDGAVMVKEGIRIAIAGEPNVGKSQLLNALCNKERAIVTDIPGTTRDTLNEQYGYKGLKFILTDTAGIRNTDDKIEKLGIERTFDAIKSADVILAVTEYGDNFIQPLDFSKPVIRVKNKIDLKNISDNDNSLSNFQSVNKNNKDNAFKSKITENETNLDKNINNERYIYSIEVSAKNGTNIDKLKELIFEAVNGAKISSSGARLNNARHYNAALDAFNTLKKALDNLFNVTLDCTISDLDYSYRALGRITGATSSEETVNEIFSRFCVGK